MTDWKTPVQVQTALETMWMKLEKNTTPLKVGKKHIQIYVFIGFVGLPRKNRIGLFFF